MRATRLAATAAALAAVLSVAVPSQAATQNIVVAGFQFAPSGWATVDPFNLTAGAGTVGLPPTIQTYKRGDTIVWTSLDPLPHKVEKTAGPTAFPSGCCVQMSLPGQTSSLATGGLAIGTYTYRCSVHPGMRGSFILIA